MRIAKIPKKSNTLIGCNLKRKSISFIKIQCENGFAFYSLCLRWRTTIIDINVWVWINLIFIMNWEGLTWNSMKSTPKNCWERSSEFPRSQQVFNYKLLAYKMKFHDYDQWQIYIWSYLYEWFNVVRWVGIHFVVSHCALQTE